MPNPVRCPVDELISEAFVGLMKSALRWNPERCMSFVTYLYKYIPWHLRDFVDRVWLPVSPEQGAHLRKIGRDVPQFARNSLSIEYVIDSSCEDELGDRDEGFRKILETTVIPPEKHRRFNTTLTRNQQYILDAVFRRQKCVREAGIDLGMTSLQSRSAYQGAMDWLKKNARRPISD